MSADRRAPDLRINEMEKEIRRQSTALFSPDDKNEFGMAGVMVNMQRMVRHTEVVCRLAKWAFGFFVAFVTLGLPTILAGRSMGWW